MPDSGRLAEVRRLAASVRPPTAADPEAVQAHLDDLTKPVGALGRLEEWALRLALIGGDPPPRPERALVVVAAGDHGVVERGVSAYPTDVTVQMCRNMAEGGAAVSVLAREVGARVAVVDFGVASAAGHPGVHDRNVRRGTRDLAGEAAMTLDEAARAILAGADFVARRAGDLDIVLLGEMGIGNTTPATALTAALLGIAPDAVVGPGTGVDGSGLARKRAAIRSGVSRIPAGAPPLRVLAEVGGLEIAGLVGVVLGAARAGLPILTDGLIATAAVLVAHAFARDTTSYVFASHRSTEPAHTLQLEALGLTPVIELELRLGEGTGAVLALPILRAAAGILRDMATFSSAAVEGGGTR